MITDIHNHILPALDDGAKTTDISLEIIKIMGEQGITKIIATPHFYANDMAVDKFIERRNESFKRLVSAAKKKKIELPEIKLGAEVYYFSGIGDCDGLRAVTLGDSNYILLELNQTSVTDSVIRDIYNLRNNLGFVPIFAHLERFAKEKGFKRILEAIDDGVALAQMNCEAVLELRTKRIASKLIKGDYISFFGTDTHSLGRRAPNMEQCLEVISTRFGPDVKNSIVDNANHLFEKI